MDNYNYPAGSDTKDAPWNQVDPPECQECEGTGKVYFSCCGDDMRGRLGESDICPTCKEHCGDEGEDCEECKGTGEEQPPEYSGPPEPDERPDPYEDVRGVDYDI